MKIINVVGARPNFMKIAPIVEEIKKYEQIKQILVHTGQHYDEKMSKLFFEELMISEPEIYLNVGSASHAKQTAEIMVRFEDILLAEQPDLTVVVGDVNSTIACALVSVKLGIPVAHIEAGLRSFDRTMPEEINRILTDSISEYLFVTEKSGEINLLREGVSKEKIFFVGNVMIDTLMKNLEKINSSKILQEYELQPKTYALLTLHRPSNADNKKVLSEILQALNKIQEHIRIVCPLHPRTKKNIKQFGLEEKFTFLKRMEGNSKYKKFIVIDPVGYLDFNKLVSQSKFILTDSGGIQEETTVLGVPCVTLRNNTERPSTIEQGTNVLVGVSKDKIIQESMKIINGELRKHSIPELWDGNAAKRIVKILIGNV